MQKGMSAMLDTIDKSTNIAGPSSIKKTAKFANFHLKDKETIGINTDDLFTRTKKIGEKVIYKPKPNLIKHENQKTLSSQQEQVRNTNVPADWITVNATHGNTKVQLNVPPGWSVNNVNDSIFASSPTDKKAIVAFMWPAGMGVMNPGALINNIAGFFAMQNYTPTYTTPVQTMPSTAVTFHSIEQDATYNLKGEKCKSHAQVLVLTSNNPYAQHWSGAIIWSQAPESKWNEYKDTLALIAANLKPAPENA